MANISPSKKEVILRKTVNSNDSRYIVACQHSYTKVLYIMELEDTSLNKHYYKFNLDLPDNAPYGEYTYYILPFDALYRYTFNHNDIRKSWYVDLSLYDPMVNFGELVLNYGEPIFNYDPDANIPNRNSIKILKTGLIQYFSFEDFKSYSKDVIYKAYERTK